MAPKRAAAAPEPSGSLTDSEIKQLVAGCSSAKSFSYSPYSRFRVGATLLTASGALINGCNVENASYGLAVCAERTALCKAVSEGHKDFRAIAITSDMKDAFCAPCGMCRQSMVEFGDFKVLLVKPDGSYKETTTMQLLPMAFTPADLDLDKRAPPSPQKKQKK
jgi:cytidine deaminase